MKDLDKRKRVMARSMRLGHCICNPKKPCPCDVFRQYDVCPCAGESMPQRTGPIRLTEMVERPGCASKIDQAALVRVLQGLPTLDDPRVLVGMPAGDDAGVFRLDGGPALVQTVDVFSPSVDDPYTFGQIAAANSLSDVYAMGGRPLTALSIVGFPVGQSPDEVLREMLRGGIDKMAEAGVPVIGGHSINENEIKAGFAVTGLVDPERIVTNAGARPGDRLILTKPLGTGIIAFASQIGRAPSGAAEAASGSMAALNRTASELMLRFDVHACTDVTGFGLMGHLGMMAEQSGVDVEIVWDDLPLLPGVLECLAEGIVPGATERNRESSGHRVDAAGGVTAAMLDICFDAQTSGGLLIVVPEPAAEPLLAALGEGGNAGAAVVGRVRGAGRGRVAVHTEGRRPLPAAAPRPAETPAACCDEAVAESRGQIERQGQSREAIQMSCCEGHGATGDERSAGAAAVEATGLSEIEAKFHAFLNASGAPGALDAHTKQAVAIALSVLARCEPCVKSHLKKARQMGFSEQQIDEAAWMAIAFGGSPTMMFYKTARR